MPITNRERFPDVDFLDDDKISVIGDVEGTALVRVSTMQDSNDLVLARSYTASPADEELFAMPLHELLAHTFGTININEELIN